MRTHCPPVARLVLAPGAGERLVAHYGIGRFGIGRIGHPHEPQLPHLARAGGRGEQAAVQPGKVRAYGMLVEGGGKGWQRAGGRGEQAGTS